MWTTKHLSKYAVTVLQYRMLSINLQENSSKSADDVMRLKFDVTGIIPTSGKLVNSKSSINPKRPKSFIQTIIFAQLFARLAKILLKFASSVAVAVVFVVAVVVVAVLPEREEY